MTTQADLARMVGVSQVAVHRALHDLPGVSDPLRTRIRKVAQEQRYRLRTSARSMLNGRANAISLLVGTESDTSALHNDLIRGIHDVLENRGQSLVINVASDAQLNRDDYVPSLVGEARTDGIIVDYTHRIPPRLLTLIEQYRIPAVYVNSKQARDAVYPDDFAAARDATCALIALGHRRITYVGPQPGDLDRHYSVTDRYRGYVAAMREHSLNPDDVTFRYAALASDTGALIREIQALWTRPDRPTAVVCYSAPHQAVLTAVMAGLCIPRDLAIVTFGSQAASIRVLTREVSQLTLPTRAVGQAAARMLLDKVAHPDTPADSVAIPFIPIQGDTCVPPVFLSNAFSSSVI